MASIGVGVAQALARSAGGPARGLTRLQAQNLVRAAAFFIEEHKRRLSKPVGAIRVNRLRRDGSTKTVQVVQRSMPGEYPRKNTGNLQNNIAMTKKSIEDVMREGKIRVGLRKRAFYGAYLEVVYARLGLSQTLRDLMPQLAALSGLPLRYNVIRLGDV